MSRKAEAAPGEDAGNWGNAFTRGLLGVSLDVDGAGRLVDGAAGAEPRPVPRRGPRPRPAAVR